MPVSEVSFSDLGVWVASATSVVALILSAVSYYETVLKRARLRLYRPSLIYMYRQDFRDVFAIPVTLSNDGAQRGTVLSFDLDVTNLETKDARHFKSLNFGDSPKGATQLFSPMTIPGRSSSTEVVLFYATRTGAFTEVTGGVTLPLRFRLGMTMDRPSGWFAGRAPAPMVFDMTATYIESFNNMEAGRPTNFYDAKWTDPAAPEPPSPRLS